MKSREQSLVQNCIVLCGFVSFVVTFIIIFAGEQLSVSSIYRTDFVSTFYVAGHMVRNGYSHRLYPQAEVNTLVAQEFEYYARELLGQGIQGVTVFFPYPPILALALAPISLLKPLHSLMVWQLISLVSLLFAAMLFSRVPQVNSRPTVIFLCSFLFFPLFGLLAIGQTSIVIGFLPLVAGYVFWQRNHPFLAGLCWSLISLKPHFLLPVTILVSSLVLSRFLARLSKFDESKNNDREAILMLAGLLVGSFSLHLIGILSIGIQPSLLWLHSIKLQSQSFGREDMGYYWPYHLVVSLPCILILALPKTYWQSAQLPAYLFGLSMMITAIIVCSRLANLKTLADDNKRDLLMIIATSSIIFVSPHLNVYDTVLLLLPAWLIFFRLKQRLTVKARSMAVIIGLAFNAYFLRLLAPSTDSQVLWQIALTLAFLVCLLFFIVQALAESRTLPDNATRAVGDTTDNSPLA